jgi:glycosyltransferase involved in cell wall biosynthesis
MIHYPENWGRMNVALAHDWLTGMRGGERVLEILCRGFASAPLYTLIHNRAAVSADINAHAIQASWLQQVPGVMEHYRYLLPLFPLAIRTFPPASADLLISTSHCVAKGLRVKPGGRHLCYCFTPMRYAWTFHDEYFGRRTLKSAVARPLLAWLRQWDHRASARVNRFVAISRHVQDRIQRFYGRESDVVYPPVNTEQWTPAPTPAPGTFDLVVSALVPYKLVDLAVQTYSHQNWPLKVVGVGTDLERLRAQAGPSVEFLGWKPDAEILDLYRSCRLLVFPGEEDFGIVPLEAQACGKPVVAFAQGGSLETIVPERTGVFFKAQTADALSDAVRTCASRTWDAAAIRRNAERFSVQAFVDALAASIDRCLERP